MRGAAVSDWSPRAALSAGIARIPEDRHAVGTIGDMSVTENVIAERYRTPRFSRRGFLDWAAARKFAEEIIADYDVKCPRRKRASACFPAATCRSSSSAARSIPTRRSSSPTSRRAASMSAPSAMSTASSSKRATRGAAILLISEDLEEILALSDRIIVMSKGRLSTPSARGERSVAQLGELMAGHGMEARVRMGNAHAA